MTRETVAQLVTRERLDRGWSKEEAARRSGVSSITWKRVEDGLRVQDAKLRLIEIVLGYEPGTLCPIGTSEAESAPVGAEAFRARQPFLRLRDSESTDPHLRRLRRLRDQWLDRLADAEVKKSAAEAEADYARQALTVTERDIRVYEATIAARDAGASPEEMESAAGRALDELDITPRQS